MVITNGNMSLFSVFFIIFKYNLKTTSEEVIYLLLSRKLCQVIFAILI